MRVYKCKTSGDELFTDAKKIEEVDGFYRVVGKNISRKGGIDESLLGANASQEEASEGTEDGTVSGIDVVLDGRYGSTQFGSKKEYLGYMKDYMKALQEKLGIVPKSGSDEEKAFQKDIIAPFTKAKEWFKELDFYTTESLSDEGIIILCRWEVPEGQTDDIPVFYYYKVGVVDEKV